MPEPVEPLSPKQVLVQWCNKNHVGVTAFANAMNYTYMHAWQLLRGKAEITPELLGRMAIAYGAESVKEIAAVMQSNGAKKGTGPLKGQES